MQEDGRALIGIGDDGVRNVLGIPKTSSIKDAARAPDFLSVTKGNALAISEVKGGKSVHLEDVLAQLENGMKAVTQKGLAGDVERVELILEKGALFNGDNNRIIKDGYLFDLVTGARVRVKGFSNFIMVIQL